MASFLTSAKLVAGFLFIGYSSLAIPKPRQTFAAMSNAAGSIPGKMPTNRLAVPGLKSDARLLTATTRASTAHGSYSATLENSSIPNPVPFTNPVYATNPAVYTDPVVNSAAVCGNQKAVLRAAYNANGDPLPHGAIFQWYYASAPNTYTPVTATTNSPTASTLEVDAPPGGVSYSQSSTYYVAIQYDMNNPSPGTESGKVSVTATFNPLSTLVVAADKLCPATTASVNMTVSNANSSMDYYWYDTNAATNPIASGPTFSPTVSVARKYYVQGVPKSGSNVCPSPITQVNIDYHQTTQPQITVPVAVIRGNQLYVNIIGDASYSYTWDWHDNPIAPPSTGLNTYHVYTQAGGYDIDLTMKDTNSPTACSFSWRFHVEVGNDLCNVLLPATSLSTVAVKRSKRNGSFVLSTTTCPATSAAFECLTGSAQTQNLAVGASAISLTDTPPAADPAYGLSAADLAANPFLAGAGRLRPEATYTYATPVLDTYTRSTERGRFQVTPFNWQVSSSYHLPAWRRGGKATRYSPDGQALEEEDILHIPSAVKLGYQSHSLPYLTAKNARYEQVLFEAFEHPNPLEGENSFTVNPAEAQGETTRSHSGNKCLLLTSIGEGDLRDSYRLTLPRINNLSGEVQLRLWLRVSDKSNPNQALDKSKVMDSTTPPASLPQVQWQPGLTTYMSIIAQTGEWMLCETTVHLGASTTAAIPVFYYPRHSGQAVWVDDVRLQPLATQMNCYVYDWNTMKLLASFDDQHFGLYYQYNAEGKLVRKQVETERGLMTIQETQYNLPRP